MTLSEKIKELADEYAALGITVENLLRCEPWTEQQDAEFTKAICGQISLRNRIMEIKKNWK